MACPVQFQAYLLELFQGQLVSCYVTPPHMVEATDIYKLFSQAYSGEPFISLPMKPPSLQDVRGTNHCHIYVRVDTRTEKILVFSVIDNLWKGASSQAIQNLNIMFGYREATGLE
ncbi:MAG TPA: Asd/ArgC dimerization domain-containing protein [Candidatus Saccharimonadales bacterium]|nr:Asd/ArgC dimerization domain-containing protein [Candidatus Saccharimonadales bacterium]